MLQKEEYLNLIPKLNQAVELYYQGKETQYADEEYDQLIFQLLEFENANPDLVDPNSPTHRVNGGSSNDKVKHYCPLLSLLDIFNHEDIGDWWKKRPGTSYVVEPKIDGLSIELVYYGGMLVSASTRGNGWEGEDVFDACCKIQTIPRTIPYQSKLVVRGEVYMSKTNFERYKKTEGDAKNPRNLAVGLLKRKDSGVGAGQYLDCWVFNLQNVLHGALNSDILFDTHYETLIWLAEQGFHVIPHTLCTDLPTILAAVDDIQDKRLDMEFQIDGAVIKENNLELRERLGDNGVVPAWAVAFKYPAVQKETRVLDIIYQLGKTGKLTPVAILDPIDIDGSTVSRCTLHNKKRMLELDIRVGDMVQLHKSGDIIPKITSSRHTSESKEFTYPTLCPRCHKELDGEVCRNASCPNKTEAKLYHWVSKGGLDAPGVSGSLVSALIERGMISTPADFYKLKPADLYKLPKMGATKVTKTLKAIDETRKRPFARVIVGLCIDQVGGAAAEKLANYAKTWDRLMNMSEEECIVHIGDSVGRKFYAAIQEEYYQNLVEELKTIFKF